MIRRNGVPSFAMPTVHQLVDVLPEKGKRLFRSRCGEVIRSADMPPDMTGWGSKVTCGACTGTAS